MHHPQKYLICVFVCVNVSDLHRLAPSSMVRSQQQSFQSILYAFSDTLIIIIVVVVVAVVIVQHIKLAHQLNVVTAISAIQFAQKKTFIHNVNCIRLIIALLSLWLMDKHTHTHTHKIHEAHLFKLSMNVHIYMVDQTITKACLFVQGRQLICKRMRR